MADGRVSGTLPSAHTWLLWDEVTAVILACTPDPFANTIASYHEPKNQRVLKLMNNSSCLMNHFSDFWNTFNCGSIFFRFLSPPLSAVSQLSCSPPLFLSLSLLLSLGLIYLAGCNSARGKAPGYICRLQRLDLLHGRWLTTWDSVLSFSVHIWSSCLLTISSHWGTNLV